MIAEPHICIKGKKAGIIEWFTGDYEAQKKADGFIYDKYQGPLQNVWQSFADFEREKLSELHQKLEDACYIESGADFYVFSVCDCSPKYEKDKDGEIYDSWDLIRYNSFTEDSESSRLLKRMEFLKAVCAKENIEWLPKYKCPSHGYPRNGCEKCIKECKQNQDDCPLGIYCPCGCHNRKPEKYSDSENEIRMTFNEAMGLIEKRLERYYTKKEIDKRFEILFEMIKKIPGAKKAIKDHLEFRKIFPFLF